MMARPGWHRPLALIPLSVGLMALAACGGAGAGDRAREASSTSPRLGEALSDSNADQKALSTHLRAEGALFYGAWWCPACFQQKNLFGKQAGNALPYVECDDEGGGGRDRCQAAGIRAFPTWEMEGRPRLEGVQTLEQLKAWSGFNTGSNKTSEQ
jgi:hypothetical protein